MAAPNITLLALSPNRGKITVLADNTGNPGTISNANLLAAFPAGTPLGDLVRKPVLNTGEAVALLTGVDFAPKLTGCCYLGVQRNGVSATPPTFQPDSLANVLIITITPPAVESNWEFYIEQIHSMIR